MPRAKKWDSRCCAGVEISTVAQCGDVHVLAFNMDTQHPAFAEEMKVISDFRRKRNEEMQRSSFSTA